MATINLIAFCMCTSTLLGTTVILLLEVFSERIDVGKELDELLKDLPDIEEEEVQIFPWFQEGDKVICIEKSAIDLVEGGMYTVVSVELRNNEVEYLRLAELKHTGVSYYARSFALLEREN